jgi:hypothetical protein
LKKRYIYCQLEFEFCSQGEALTWYFGASLLKNKNGPMMLPTQYAINIIALTVAFLVNPATFDETIDKVIGIPAA